MNDNIIKEVFKSAISKHGLQFESHSNSVVNLISPDLTINLFYEVGDYVQLRHITCSVTNGDVYISYSLTDKIYNQLSQWQHDYGYTMLRAFAEVLCSNNLDVFKEGDWAITC